MTEMTAADAEALIAAGLCPYCDRGPFVVPLSHIARAHGIPGADQRDLIAAPTRRSLCDPEHSARYSAAMLGRQLPRPQHRRPARKTQAWAASTARGLAASRRKRATIVRCSGPGCHNLMVPHHRRCCSAECAAAAALEAARKPRPSHRATRVCSDCGGPTSTTKAERCRACDFAHRRAAIPAGRNPRDARNARRRAGRRSERA